MRVLYRLHQQLRRTYGHFLGRPPESKRSVETRTNGHGDDAADVAETSDAVGTRQSETTWSEADLLLEDGVTPKERFVELIETNGGWLRQKQLVEATNLSKATVSRTLSSMESAGEITRRRVGRENIVYLSGCEPSNPAKAMRPEADDRSAT
ncbi:helix-turn-helix transcriptional regulator [Halogranum rubrum]|uniref:helix-turn-helix transcriptional regulator n=1 Tax=Halogranum rubrum TaxID=553466 RepID=UPI0011601218|nr:MarR family transcriptional regulator [Halogranum rubrum]